MWDLFVFFHQCSWGTKPVGGSVFGSGAQGMGRTDRVPNLASAKVRGSE